MGLDGGGGGGILGVGGTFTGPAEALEIVGDHCFAYPGAIGASSSSVQLLKFTTGNYYVVGTFFGNGSCEASAPANGNLTVFTIKFNGAIISLMKTESGTSTREQMTVRNDLVISSYTEVEVLMQSDANTSDRLVSAVFTGRIYRG